MAEVTLKLVVLRGGPNLKPEYPLNQQTITVGRSVNNLIVLNDNKVSRYHAEIVKTDKEYVIKDLDSANGIRINGSRCLSKTLEPKDVIQIGDSEFRVEQSVSRLEQLEIKEYEGSGDVPSFVGPPTENAGFTQKAASTQRLSSIPGFGAAQGAEGDAARPIRSQASLGEGEIPPFGKAEGVGLGAALPPFGDGAAPITLNPADHHSLPGFAPPFQGGTAASPSGVFKRNRPAASDLLSGPPVSSAPPTSHKLLEHQRVAKGKSEIGGMEALVQWLGRRARAFGGQAKAFGLSEPSAITVIGGPGLGKTLVTRYVASGWNVNFFRLHLPYLLFSPPEHWMTVVSEALTQVISYQPALLAIEDMDKMLGRVEVMGDVVKRAYLMTIEVLTHWVRTKGPAPFTIVTGTDPRLIHPELLRKSGSLDEVFFIDLPQKWERMQIIETLLIQRNRFPDRFDLKQLIDASEAFSGAQIEDGISAALYEAFSESREPTTADVTACFGKIIPIGHLWGTYFDELRQWGMLNARPAAFSAQEKQAALGASRGPAPFKVSPLSSGGGRSPLATTPKKG